MPLISDNIDAVRRTIYEACLGSGRDVADVRLIAVTKTVGIEEIHEAIRSGITDFGENRVRDALPKVAAVRGNAVWHFIGHLQTNKVRAVIGFAEWIHSLDSLRLASAIDDEAGTAQKRQKVLIEVNVADEPSKFGFKVDEVPEVLDELVHYRNLEVRGLMTMAPLGIGAKVSDIFNRLRELSEREQKKQRQGIDLDQLSMGMTQDYREAIKAGATMVRIGTAIFGTEPEVVT